MFLAVFEPGQEMAIANFFLAIFCLFTISLPLLLITRGDKTESNRNFIASTFNPWSQISKEIKLTSVIESGITPEIELQPNPNIFSENNDEPISESEGLISIDIKKSKGPEVEVSSVHELASNDEVLAA
tara:strand:- start:906 stop:1292 length:387 start_codon:yes stop_codon:yes gene_type:complete